MKLDITAIPVPREKPSVDRNTETDNGRGFWPFTIPTRWAS